MPVAKPLRRERDYRIYHITLQTMLFPQTFGLTDDACGAYSIRLESAFFLSGVRDLKNQWTSLKNSFSFWKLWLIKSTFYSRHSPNCMSTEVAERGPYCSMSVGDGLTTRVLCIYLWVLYLYYVHEIYNNLFSTHCIPRKDSMLLWRLK